jgi:hypothetical protein
MKRYAALALLFAACGDDGGHMQTVDAPLASVDAHPDAPPDAPSPATAGLIEVTQGIGGGNADSDVDVHFSNVLFGPVAGTDGPCTVYGTGDTPRYSAGDLTITGTSQPVTMTASGTAPDVSYDSAAAIPANLFTAGTSIHVSAAGGPEVPAFTATVTAPQTLAGFTPPTTVSRSGYTATWTAGTGPGMWVIFAAFDTNSGDGNVGICRVDDTGSFTIPASTWALTPASATAGFVGVGRVAPVTVMAGNATVVVQAVSYITSDDVTLTN